MTKNNYNPSILLVNVRDKYEEGMSEKDVYEIARSAWRLDKSKIDGLKYVLAIYHCKVKGVFRIIEWRFISGKKRWEFDGEIAPPDICAKYLDEKFRMFGPVGYL